MVATSNDSEANNLCARTARLHLLAEANRLFPPLLKLSADRPGQSRDRIVGFLTDPLDAGIRPEDPLLDKLCQFCFSSARDAVLYL